MANIILRQSIFSPSRRISKVAAAEFSVQPDLSTLVKEFCNRANNPILKNILRAGGVDKVLEHFEIFGFDKALSVYSSHAKAKRGEITNEQLIKLIKDLHNQTHLPLLRLGL